MDWALDYSTYHVSTKYMMDLENGREAWSKPKLNKNNNLFVKNIDKITYNDVDLIIFNNNNNDGKDTTNTEQQDSKPVFERNDDGLHIPDTTDNIEKES